MRDYWYKEAIIYCLDVDTFLNSNGDGIGDFTGLMRRLDYIAGLGVTCLWLLPFYPSPNRDNGYDVMEDHYECQHGTNRVRTLFTSVGHEADRVGPT